ncbi:unnamed protein product [Adineta ricciae]|uniref:FYVE-type domain-containing protein n=1 Tax=Adineta ricciae TaxID=249248 RepID=A0A814WBX7_ADIRI|nr:unnamed protein product [Adineta ricciae]CAF1196545.1 unnamed protein product [Adineta ricciae]
MDLSTARLDTIEDFTADRSNSDFDMSSEELRKQISELTEQLNESRTAEKRAINEREKYLQMYNRTNERFVQFERKQLDQMRRILSILTPNQHKTLAINQDEYQRPRRAFTSPSTSILLPSTLDGSGDESNIRMHLTKTESEWNDLLAQISKIMEFSEKFADKYAQKSEENTKLRLLNNQKQDENVKLLFDLSVAKAEYEKEQHKRTQYEQQLSEANKVIEQDRSKRLQKLRNYASLADDEGDILLSSLMKKAEKNDMDFREIKLQYENVFIEQVKQIKKLVKEREISHLYIQRLQAENVLLASRTTEDETVKLLTQSSQSPQSYEEACSLIIRLREQIIEQIKQQDRFRSDLQQLQQHHKTDMREREQIEELLNRDLAAAKDEILVLQSIRTEYDRIIGFKKDLEVQLEDCVNELRTTKTMANSLTNQLKEKMEQISAEKDKLSEDNAGLRVQLQKLKIDFENSESVQHDFVKLSQALQVQLEELRNSENELRWQPEEDYTECQRCRQQFSVTWRKHHCRHCGKVLCKDCTSKTIYTGPNNRPSRVCDVCYTLLDKSVQPYFLSGVPKY